MNLARFESREAAEANSARPEQGAWWTEMAQCFDGEPTFRNSDDVTVYERGDLDIAGFVQVMEGRVHDADAARAIVAEVEHLLARERPDLLGEVQILHPDGTYTDVAYFTSEEEARAGEAKEPSAEAQAAMQRMSALYEVTEYLDLRTPFVYWVGEL